MKVLGIFLKAIFTHRVLQQLCDAFEPLPPTNRPASYAPKSVTDIAARNYKLADNMKFRLLGTIQLYPALYNTATPNVMTPAEQMGIKVIIVILNLVFIRVDRIRSIKCLICYRSTFEVA